MVDLTPNRIPTITARLDKTYIARFYFVNMFFINMIFILLLEIKFCFANVLPWLELPRASEPLLSEFIWPRVQLIYNCAVLICLLKRKAAWLKILIIALPAIFVFLFIMFIQVCTHSLTLIILQDVPRNTVTDRDIALASGWTIFYLAMIKVQMNLYFMGMDFIDELKPTPYDDFLFGELGRIFNPDEYVYLI